MHNKHGIMYSIDVCTVR